MNVTLICVGRLKEDYLRAACAEYQKRLQAFCRFNVEELEAEKLTDAPSEAEIAAALEKEGDRILAKLPKGAYAVALCIEGKQQSSEELASLLADIPVQGNGSAAFVIGSSYGLSDKVKRAAQLKLSMSKMTFPHQLARVMLMEQVYRAYSIINNRKYHK
ncbi:MAG: 23S rRNA (pseudouridine(1915)-N(3))-methyltransferase RlmH [Oscillospiraceae bacterium]|nr:23S rRNA (pseudouridine(1915)-N(3))-methyltransferase RlmH [Oscillospiraceae bacterium]